MKAEDITPIHFLAQMLNSEASKAEGYHTCTLWCTLREDLQKKYLIKAEGIVSNFQETEIQAQENRNKGFEGIKFTKVS